VASEALRGLYEADQADRMNHPIDWNVVSKRDRERRVEVRRLLDVGEVQDVWDHYWAAFVLIHSHDVADLEDALRLSRRAVELDPQPLQVRALYPAVKDRLLLSQGEPQWYGTQKVLVGLEVVLAPIDPDMVTDEERTTMGVLTLDERHREINRMNRARAEQRRRAATSRHPQSQGDLQAKVE
jgi:hypothetical protein